jgi:hypothetical protein
VKYITDSRKSECNTTDFWYRYRVLNCVAFFGVPVMKHMTRIDRHAVSSFYALYVNDSK